MMKKQNLLVLSLCGLAALCACSGEDGINGPAGPEGPTGPVGPTGGMGSMGTNGTNGMNGMNGMPGMGGTDGMNGVDGRGFNFRTETSTAYTRVDRMGMPAVATALVIDKNAYNDADPSDDVVIDTGTGLPMFVGSDIAPSLVTLHSALRDDLEALKLTACSGGTPQAPDVLPCAVQTVGPGGPTVLSLIVPDTITLDPTAPAGFPNGRRVVDPVIDVTLAVILLDLTVHSAAAFAALPLNPPANDLPFSARFPYLAYPHVD